MKSRKGFTLVELMVVVVIVALLAALLIPMLTARIEAARWSEGKAAAGTIATTLRAYVIERAELDPDNAADIQLQDFFNLADLTGKYFTASDYTLADVIYQPDTTGTGEYVIEYTITVDQGNDTVKWTKVGFSLDHTGVWKEISGTN